MPAFIKGNRVAVDFWQRHAPALEAAGRLTPLQADAFALVAEMFSELRALTDMVAAEGMSIDTPRGPRENPKVRTLRDARRDLLAAARGFGLDAVSDARLPAEPPEPELSVIDRFRAAKEALDDAKMFA